MLDQKALEGFNDIYRHVQTNLHNALTRVIQFVCTRRRSYKTSYKESLSFQNDRIKMLASKERSCNKECSYELLKL